MWQYSLDLEGDDERRYVPSHAFHGPVGIGDMFDYDGCSYEVVRVVIKQFKPNPGEPPRTLHCRVA
jgi:hypothetical protein